MNFPKWVTAICAAAFLAACAHEASQPPPPPAPDIVTIPPQDLYSHWWRSSNPNEGLHALPGTGCVSIELTIDSKGKVHDMKVVALSGPQEFPGAMLTYYAGQRFYPAPTNPERTPIKTTITVSYSEGAGADPKAAEPCTAQLGDSAK